MSQKLVSELIVKLTQQVTGPAAEARKSLESVEQAMAAIGKQRAAEERITALGKAQEVARDKVRQLAQELAAADAPTKRLMNAYEKATSASDQIAKALDKQRAAAAANAENLKNLGVVTGNVAGAERQLMGAAEKAAAAFVKATQEEARAARLRQSFLKETAKAAADEAAVNRQMIADQETSARRSLELAQQTAREQVEIAERGARAKREAWLREATREANQEAELNKRILADEAKAAERRDAIRRGVLTRPLHTAAGIGTMIVGGSLEHVMVKGVETGAEIESAKVKMLSSGMSDHEIEGATDRSVSLQRQYPNMRRTELMDLEKQAYTILPERHEVAEFMPIFAKFASAYKVAHPKAQGEEVIRSLEAFFKASELEGSARTSEGFARALDAKLKALNYQGGLIKADDFLGFAKQAGGAATMLSEQFRNTIIPIIMAEMGGERTGTFIQAVNKQAVGDFQGNNHALAEWIDMGLIKKNQVLTDKSGKAIGLKPGQHPVGYQDMITDPLAFTEHTLTPYMRAGLARRNKKLTPAEREKLLEETEGSKDGKSLAESHPEVKADLKMIEELAEIRRLFPNAVAARGMQELYIQDQALRRHQENMKTASGLDSADNVSKDPIAALSSFTTAISNFMGTLSNPMMKDAAGILSGWASGISSVTEALAEFQKAHPDVAKGLAVATTGAGVLGGGALAWGAVDGLMSGFGLKGSALALDGAAAALTRAAVVQGGAGVLEGRIIGGAATGGILSRLMGGLGILGFLGAAGWTVGSLREDLRKTNPELDERLKKNPTDGMIYGEGAVDPNLQFKSDPSQMGPAARWLRNMMGLDPNAPAPDPRGPQRPATAVPGAVDDFGRPIDAAPSGEKSGQDLGSGIAKGLEKQSSVIEDQANQILARVAMILQQGVTVPIRLDASTVQAAAQTVQAQADHKVNAMLRSTFAHPDFA